MAASFRCYDNSNVIAFLIMTNFHLYLIKLWWQFFQMFVYAQNWEVLALKNCCSIEPPSYASAAYVVASYDPRFFSTVRFVKIRATCENFLGKWFTASPGKKFPVRLCKREIQKATIPIYYKHNKSHTCKFICLTLYLTRYLQVVF